MLHSNGGNWNILKIFIKLNDKHVRGRPVVLGDHAGWTLSPGWRLWGLQEFRNIPLLDQSLGRAFWTGKACRWEEPGTSRVQVLRLAPLETEWWVGKGEGAEWARGNAGRSDHMGAGVWCWGVQTWSLRQDSQILCKITQTNCSVMEHGKRERDYRSPGSALCTLSTSLT